MKSRSIITVLVGSLFLVLLTPSSASTAPPLPNPILYLTGTEFFHANGKDFIRYKYDVLNKDDYPDAMFAAASAMPPCGNNTKASWTWVDLFDSCWKRFLGFSALGKAADLCIFWFALEWSL